jgi:group I intron endonuclease
MAGLDKSGHGTTKWGMTSQSGIYTVTAPSGGKYVGSAIDFNARWRVHRHLLAKGRHHNKALQRAFLKYGKDGLTFERLIICRPDDLLMFEQRTIDVLKPRYNSSPVAGSQLGFRHTQESNEKNSAAHRGKKQPPEQRAQTAARMKGRKHGLGHVKSPEQRARHSAALKGKKHRDGFEAGLTSEKRGELVQRYTAGDGLVNLADKNHTSHKVIRKILIAEGVDLRPKGANLHCGPARKLSNGEIAKRTATRAKNRAALLRT